MRQLIAICRVERIQIDKRMERSLELERKLTIRETRTITIFFPYQEIGWLLFMFSMRSTFLLQSISSSQLLGRSQRHVEG